MSLTRLGTRISVFTAVLMLGACASSPLPKAYERSSFLQGDVTLGCVTINCAIRWQSNQEALLAAYAAEDWDALAAMVTGLQFAGDLAYFYLGRAAQGMDAYGAASRYYERAGGAQARCDSSVLHSCHGIDVQAEAELRSERLATMLAPPTMALEEAQYRLSQLGLYTIAVDGIPGPHTTAAIRQFQVRERITASGELDAATVTALLETSTAATVRAEPSPESNAAAAPKPSPSIAEPQQAANESPQQMIALSSVAELPSSIPTPERTRTTVEVDLLADADPFAEILAVVEQGAWVTVIAKGSEWSLVSYREKTGYVYTDILQ